MMKKLLITLFTALMVSASFGQKDLQVILSSPTSGSTERSISTKMTITIKNNGTTTIPVGDTMIVYMSIGTQIFAFGSGNQGFVTLLPVTTALAPGASTGPLNSAELFLSSYPTTATTATVCSWAYIRNNADTDSTNNRDCYTWDISTASTPEVTLEESTKVYVANNFLNLSSTVKETLNYTVVSITGQVVSQGTFNGSRQVDLTGISKGIYAIVVTNGTEKVTKKVVVQ